MIDIYIIAGVEGLDLNKNYENSVIVSLVKFNSKY